MENNKIRLKEVVHTALGKGTITGNVTGENGIAHKLLRLKNHQTSYNTYNKYCEGKMRKMDPETAHRICEVLECTLDDLFGYKG